MSALICPRCGREIRPGDAVELVSPNDPDDVRIFTSDEALIVHADCPDDEVTS